MNKWKKPVREIICEKRQWQEPVEETGEAVAPSKFRGWYTRGTLPHFDKPGLIQFISYRLFDSMPASKRHEWEPLLQIKTERERITKIEAYIDAGYGSCFLANAEIAQIVENNLLHFDGLRYRLVAWVIMPNHLHIACEIWTESLPRIIKSWKSYTATQSNILLNRIGQGFWHSDFFDRYIRDEDHFVKTIRYIENNPIKAGLVKTAEEWPFSSANPRWMWSEDGVAARYRSAKLLNQHQLAAETSRAPSEIL